MIDLCGELWQAIQAVQPAHRERLGLCAPLDIGIAKVRFDGPLYEPDESGATAVLLPVFDGPDPLCSEFYDVVAWRPTDDRLATRMGFAVCLGSLDHPLSMGAPLSLHRSPRTWLGMWDSAVVVDWDRAEALYLLGDRRIVADDVDHGLEVQKRLDALRLRAIPPMPTIAVRAA